VTSGRKSAGEFLSATVRGDRRNAGLSQQGLADQAGVSIGMIRDLEQNRTTKPCPDSMRRLVDVLGGASEDAYAALVVQFDRHRCAAAAADTRMSDPGSDSRLWIQVLGPLAVWRDGVPVPVSGKQRLMLAVLALHANVWVHRETLVDALWALDPPPSGRSLVQTYAARLRRLLALRTLHHQPERFPLTRSGSGYRLVLGENELDLLVLHEVTAAARQSLAAGDIGTACVLYEKAIYQSRTAPLCDVDSLRNTALLEAIPRGRATIVTEFAQACAARGWYGRSLPHLQVLVERDPLNERAQACLMIALAGVGQQAAAVNRYHTVRYELDQQLGIRPGTDLTDAYSQILHHQLVPCDRPQIPLATRSA